MAEQVFQLPPGYKGINGVETSGPGKGLDLVAALKDDKNALALLERYWKQHAEKPPRDFNAHGLVFRVVATVENTPQRGWGTLIVELGYKPRGHKKH
jgi:hypothetical protein